MFHGGRGVRVDRNQTHASMISVRMPLRALELEFDHDSLKEFVIIIERFANASSRAFGLPCGSFLGWGRRVGQRAGGACPTKAALRGRRGSKVKGGTESHREATPKAPLTLEGRPRTQRRPHHDSPNTEHPTPNSDQTMADEGTGTDS